MAQVKETVVAEMFGADMQNFERLCRRISSENKIKILVVQRLLVTSQGADFQTERLSLHFLKGGEEHPGLGLHLLKILATGGPKAG